MLKKGFLTAEVVFLLLVVCSGGGGGVHGNQHELVRLGGQCGTECQRQIE